MGKARSPVVKLKAPAPARSISLQLDMSRRNVHPRMPDFNELAARIHALKNDMSCLLPLYINKIVVVNIDESLFVQFSSSAFYPPCCLEKPLKAPKMQKKEYDETDLDNLKKNKENEKALKELKDKAAPSTLGCAGLKKSSKKKHQKTISCSNLSLYLESSEENGRTFRIAASSFL